MNLIGFNFTKISAEVSPDLKDQPFAMNTNIEFVDMQKEEIEVLNNLDSLKASFRFVVTYKKDEGKEKKGKEEEKGKVILEGNLILSADKEDVKEMLKHWKKQEIPVNFKIPMFNIIIRKCAAKSLQLEEDIGLPAHIPIPMLRLEAPSNREE